MNSRPLFAALTVFILASCQKDSEEEIPPVADAVEDKLEKPFLMPVEDVFMIEGRGVIVTGSIERGVVALEDKVEIVGILDTKESTVRGIEMFRKVLETGKAGDNVGVLLSGVTKEDLQRGMVLAAPGSISAHTKFEAKVKLLTSEEGGRIAPVFDGYRPQCYFRTADVTGVMTLPGGTKGVEPGDNVSMKVELNTPTALEVGTGFALREGGRTVGSGVVTAIVED